uniref:Leucine-rich repeat and WD repeat-containing protein 1 n=1 Tax=Oncorhynchus mykiss TaxID=8022 RepID=A0A8C7QGH9_ONCMY
MYRLDMGKITEKLLLEKCTPKNTKLEQVKTLNLSKLGLKSSDLPVPLLSRLRCLEQLDLSGNRLQEMPSGLVLPSLRSLDLTNNEMEDVTTLDTLTTLEDLRMEDNLYITINDNYKLIILLPKLRFYNGKDISDTANHIRYANSENLRKRVLALWETSFSLPDHRTAENLAIVERDFVNAVCHKVKYGPSSLTDYTKWRVGFNCLLHFSFPYKDNYFILSEYNWNHVYSLTVSVQAEDSPHRSSRLQSIPHKAERPISTTPRTHKADQIPATPISGQSKLPVTPRNGLREKQHQSKGDMPLAKRTRKSAKQQRSTEVNETPGKVICTKSQHSSQEPVSLQPLHVLQCHSKQDSPDDFSTQLWACSFQPPLDYNGGVNGATRIVATCGGESVCLIDCETGLVMKKYKVPGEEFFSLAWSTVLMSRKGNVGMRPCSILAAGGKRGLVKLLHPRANMAYGEFRASRKALSILCFSPRQGNLLFTGSYDKNILLWDIGGVDSYYNFKVTRLLVLETTSTPLHFCLPPATPDTHLIAACEKGLHSYNIQLNKDPKKRSEEMEITFPVYEKDTDHDYHTIDGLGFLTNDVVASKSHMQGSIYLWSWNDTQAQRPKKKEVCAVILMELQWSSTDIPYLSLNTCPSKGYVVCGDERGRLWTYHVTDLKANFRSGKAIPATEILAWPLPVRNGQGPVEGPPINSVAMDPELRYLVALSDKNMAVVWIRTESS